MARSETELTEAEWDAKWKGPRDRLLKEVFGDAPCPVTDVSPRIQEIDENWDKKIDFMASSKPRMTNPLNMNNR